MSQKKILFLDDDGNFLEMIQNVMESFAGESWEIHGQVVDEQGTPVEDFDAAKFWSSNGKQWDEAGEWIKISGLAAR